VRLASKEGPVIETESAVEVRRGQEVWFAIRPEKVRIAHQAPEGAVNRIEGAVADIAYFGDMTLYNVRLPSGTFVRASMLNAERTVASPITWDDTVWLSWTADAGVVLTS
jgi:putrescine transport system ATP-binding protein